MMKLIKLFSVILCILYSCLTLAQTSPIELKLLFGGQMQTASSVTSNGSGWLTGGQLGYKFNDHFAANFRVTFDRMDLKEDSVLLEWDWAYWDQRYIDWMLTGAIKEEVDSISTILEYWHPDSTYHGMFNPYQWTQELRFSMGFEYRQPLNEKLLLYGELGLGFNQYERRLKMVEDWWKVFTWEWDSTKIAAGGYSDLDLENYETFMDLHENDPDVYQLDRIFNGDSTEVTYHFEYDYYARVTHFAPDKVGIRLFITPVVGLRYKLSRSVDFDIAYHGVWYLNGEIVERVEDLFRIDKDSRKWFPFDSKSAITIVLTFKY